MRELVSVDLMRINTVNKNVNQHSPEFTHNLVIAQRIKTRIKIRGSIKPFTPKN